jgi:hypothetical protein
VGLAAPLRQPYLATMSWFPRPVSPRAALADLRAFMGNTSREQRLGAILAGLSTTIIVIVFFVDAKINTAPPPQVIYVNDWRADRSDEEIKAEQKTDQAAREAALKERQRQFQELENKLGIE